MAFSQKVCGLTELYRPKNGYSDIDIVAIHGLNGDARRSWTNATTRSSWLSHGDFLPAYVPTARVLSWGYNSSFSSISGALPSNNFIHHHAQTLIAQLVADRTLEGRTEHPIIFLCHSLGGLVVKRALSYSKSREDNQTTHNIFIHTFGILFFGTPHRGSSHADLLLTLQKLATLTLPRKLVQNESVLVTALREESETLQNITDYFDPLIKYFHVHFFWEEEKTDLHYKKEYIVTKDSAAPEYDNTERSGIAATHSNMVKFGSPDAPGFRTVVATLSRYHNLAVQAMQRRRRRVSSISSLPSHSSSDGYTTATAGGGHYLDPGDGGRTRAGDRQSAGTPRLYMPVLPADIGPLVIGGREYTFGPREAGVLASQSS